MCGRFRLSRHPKIIKDHFGFSIDVEWEPRYNIAPGQQIATVRQDPAAPVREFSRMKWGLIPFWAKDKNIGYKMINARSETAASKPAFRDALKKRRCLIPADAFYEWKKTDSKSKQPFCFTMADDSVFAFAGIWDRWKTPEGNAIESCSILTTAPNALLADVHDRMPVILPADSYDLWLDPGFTDAAEITSMLTPYDAKQMRRFPISQRVNSVKNDDAAVSEPFSLAAAQGQ